MISSAPFTKTSLKESEAVLSREKRRDVACSRLECCEDEIQFVVLRAKQEKNIWNLVTGTDETNGVY